MKGTVWYLSDVISAITTIFTVIFLLFISSLVIFVSQITINGQITGTIFYDEPLTDNMLMTVLDSTVEGVPVSELLPYAIGQESTTVTLNGKTYDLQTSVEDTMNKITTRAYKVEIVDGPVLASKGALLDRFSESSAPVFAGSNTYTVKLSLRSLA